jgi:SAM-dependent methyltransferase
MTNHCYLCGSGKLDVTRTELRHGIKRKVFECRNCGLVFLDGHEKDMQSFYASKAYRKKYSPVIGKESSSKEIFEIYKPVMASRLARVKQYLGKNKRVLDVGCSAGHFLAIIKPYVKEAVGLEYSLDNAAFVRKTLGVKVYTEPIEKTDLPKKYFDVIFCLQTFEHMPDPVHFLESVKPYLKRGGMIYLEVPNLHEGTLALYHNQAYDDFYYREPHLFYYTAKTLARVTKKAGYTGKVLPFQWYNLINQMHWILANAPQTSGFDGLRDPVLVTAKDVKSAVRNAFNAWFQKADKEYKALLEEHMVSDQIVFVGKPAK